MTAGSGSGSGSGSAITPAPDATIAAPAPTWKVESQLVALECGDKPLQLPPPAKATKPVVDRALGHGDVMTVCQDQVSVAAACTCLAGAIEQWGPGIHAPAECEIQKQMDPNAQLVAVTSNPRDGSSKSSGEAFVLVAKHGATWSAAGVVEAASEVDLSETPKAVHTAQITRFESHPIANGALYWIESQNETQEHSMGDLDHDGSAQATICIASAGQPFCYKPLSLGEWLYSWTTEKAAAPDACAIRSVSSFQITLDAAAASVQLRNGTDTEGIVGHYRL